MSFTSLATFEIKKLHTLGDLVLKNCYRKIIFLIRLDPNSEATTLVEAKISTKDKNSPTNSDLPKREALKIMSLVTT